MTSTIFCKAPVASQPAEEREEGQSERGRRRRLGRRDLPPLALPLLFCTFQMLQHRGEVLGEALVGRHHARQAVRFAGGERVGRVDATLEEDAGWRDGGAGAWAGHTPRAARRIVAPGFGGGRSVAPRPSSIAGSRVARSGRPSRDADRPISPCRHPPLLLSPIDRVREKLAHRLGRPLERDRVAGGDGLQGRHFGGAGGRAPARVKALAAGTAAHSPAVAALATMDDGPEASMDARHLWLAERVGAGAASAPPPPLPVRLPRRFRASRHPLPPHPLFPARHLFRCPAPRRRGRGARRPRRRRCAARRRRTRRARLGGARAGACRGGCRGERGDGGRERGRGGRRRRPTNRPPLSLPGRRRRPARPRRPPPGTRSHPLLFSGHLCGPARARVARRRGRPAARPARRGRHHAARDRGRGG